MIRVYEVPPESVREDVRDKDGIVLGSVTIRRPAMPAQTADAKYRLWTAIDDQASGTFLVYVDGDEAYHALCDAALMPVLMETCLDAQSFAAARAAEKPDSLTPVFGRDSGLQGGRLAEGSIEASTPPTLGDRVRAALSAQNLARSNDKVKWMGIDL